MKLKFLIILTSTLLLFSCSNSSSGGTAAQVPANGGGGQGGQPANQLDTNSPMYGLIGEWVGHGDLIMKQKSDQKKYQCDQVTLTISPKTSTTFSFKSVFDCTDVSAAASQFSLSEEDTWTLKDNNIFAGEILLGSINAGVANLHLVQDGYDLTWNISVSGKHMTYTHISQSQDFYLSESAELALP